MARRRRLSIVIAQLGSGITRSPALPDLVDGSRSNPTLYGGSDANVHRRSRGQIDFVPTDGDTLPNPASGRQHHQRQIRQIPDLSRLAGLRYGKPLLTFLGARGLRRGAPSMRAVSRTGLIVTAPCLAAKRIRPEMTIFAVRAPLTLLRLIAANTPSTAGVSTSRTRSAPRAG